MSHAALPKLRKITILDRQNVPSGGALIIPSKLDYLDLLQLDRILDGRPVVYLQKQGAALSPEVQAHLGQDHVHVQEFTPSATSLDALRKEVQDVVKKGGIVDLRAPAGRGAERRAHHRARNGPRLPDATARSGARRFTSSNTAEVAMAIESRAAAGDSVFAFGRVLEAPDVASFQESLVQLAEACFSGKPALDINLAYALLRGLKKHGTRASVIDGKDEQKHALRQDSRVAPSPWPATCAPRRKSRASASSCLRASGA